jgi:hypothetical protein
MNGRKWNWTVANAEVPDFYRPLDQFEAATGAIDV